MSYLTELNEESSVLDTVQSAKGKTHLDTETNQGLLQTFTLILGATDPQAPVATMCLRFSSSMTDNPAEI